MPNYKLSENAGGIGQPACRRGGTDKQATGSLTVSDGRQFVRLMKMSASATQQRTIVGHSYG